MRNSFNIDVDVRGIAKAIAQINRFDQTIQQRIKDTVNEFALKIQKSAKKRCPVDTGRLRSSIVIEPYNDGFTAHVGTNVKYAPYVEFGTGKYAVDGNGRKKPWAYKNREGELIWTAGQKPQPFLIPAANEHKQAYINAMRKILRDVKP
jgi:HK97 gp10 family phage protein